MSNKWFVTIKALDHQVPLVVGPYHTEKIALEIANNLEILVVDEEEVFK